MGARVKLLSRLEVTTAGHEAWAWDRKFTAFYFDGARFWHHNRRDDSLTPVPSWRSPRNGWLHSAECSCRYCNSIRERSDAAA